MNKSAIPKARSLDVSHYPGEPSRKSLSKIFPSIFPCNPLKRLDPDERIQGNPTRVSGGFRSKRGARQEKPNGSAGPMLSNNTNNGRGNPLQPSPSPEPRAPARPAPLRARGIEPVGAAPDSRRGPWSISQARPRA